MSLIMVIANLEYFVICIHRLFGHILQYGYEMQIHRQKHITKYNDFKSRKHYLLLYQFQ